MCGIPKKISRSQSSEPGTVYLTWQTELADVSKVKNLENGKIILVN